jgi:hypothetical protein
MEIKSGGNCFMSEIIQIKDPALNQDEIFQVIQEQLSQREAIPNPESFGPDVLHPRHTKPNEEAAKATADLDTQLMDLIMSFRLEEQPFVSDAPVVGPLIVGLRRVWNWMSTKWYVRPIMHQQTRVNSRIVLLLMEMNELHVQKDRQIASLQERLAALEESAGRKRN